MYDVVLLVEQELTEPDAKRVVELREEMPEQVRYHLLIPCENAEASVEASLAALGSVDLYDVGNDDQRAGLAEAQRAIDADAKAFVERSVERLQDLGQQADGTITHERAVDAVVERVKQVNGQEVIILTRSHLVAEFFHVDCSAQARRHLGVPVLHLLEQDEQPAR